jgi:hypothetical protein
MRIDIGPHGRIIGTKRVAASGQIAGLGHYAGKDLLLLAPEGHPKVAFSAREQLLSWQKAAAKSVEDALEAVQAARAKLPTPRASLQKVQRKVRRQARAQWKDARKLVRVRVAKLRKDERVHTVETWLKARGVALPA